MIILKEKIIEKINERNLSISKLERKAGLTIHSLRNLLKGNIKNPRVDILSATAKALECSVLDFIIPSSFSTRFEQKKYILNKKKNTLDHPDFMIACSNVVTSLLKEKALILSLDDYFDTITTLYFYSLTIDPRTPDIKFAEWLLQCDHIPSGTP
ncbi:MAG: helix-turn-helix transcriptional regulator [Alphaproteobacteria bacterium]|nr:helix-turn-helix transcriptional regulator [Alphaproteobacteria bacterium]